MKILLVLSMLLISLQLFSQSSDSLYVNPKDTGTKHEVGFSAGYTTGVGISYRYYPKKIGIQITTAPIISADYAWLSIGTSLMFTVNETRVTKFYVYYGNHVLFESDAYTYTWDPENGEIIEYSKSLMYNTGIGAGIELTAWQRVGFNFNFGLGASFEPDLNHNENLYWQTSIIGGAGIFYKF